MSLWQTIAQWPRAIWGAITRAGSNTVQAIAPSSNKPTWPPAEHLPRLRTYARNARLYRGEHKAVFVDSREFQFEYDQGREYVAVNLLRALTDLLSWRLFGEGITIAVPDDQAGTQEFLDHLYRRNRLDQLNLCAAMTASYCGDATYKVRYDATEQRIVIETVDPAAFYPEYAPLDRCQMTSATIAQVLWSGRQAYLWQERHELREGTGWIVNTLHRLRGDVAHGQAAFDPIDDRVSLETLEATATLPEEQPTGVDRLLVVHVPNRRTDQTGPWGISDYEGLLPIQGEYNHRLTQRAEVLDKFVDPFVYGPDLADENGEVTLGRDNKYITIPESNYGGQQPVGIVAWDPQLQAVTEELQELRQQFASTAGVELTALSEMTGGPVSGRALRLSQMRTQATVSGKQLQFSPGLQEVFSLATKLAMAPGVKLAFAPAEGAIVALEPEDITIEFGDGLPPDRTEEIEEQARMVEMGLQSKLDAIRLLHGLDDDGAQQRLDQIEQERKGSAPQVPELRVRSPFEAPENDAAADLAAE